MAGARPPADRPVDGKSAQIRHPRSLLRSVANRNPPRPMLPERPSAGIALSVGFLEARPFDPVSTPAPQCTERPPMEVS